MKATKEGNVSCGLHCNRQGPKRAMSRASTGSAAFSAREARDR
jgi:hypothetical protein